MSVDGQSWMPVPLIAAFKTAAQADSAASCPLAPLPLVFFPTAPCRAVDTRPDQRGTGDFGGPFLAPYATRDFPLQSVCSLGHSGAAPYSLNFTVAPHQSLDVLSVWQAGQPFPTVSTLNSPAGATLANAAIVPAGSNGTISVLAAEATELIIEANGYFAPPNGHEVLFYPVTPCRLVDTRTGQGKAGAFGPPPLSAYANRDFSVAGNCNVSTAAQAYVLNVTAVPHGRLDFLSAWPAGQSYPGGSTLNSPDGSTIANAAVLRARAWRDYSCRR